MFQFQYGTIKSLTKVHNIFLFQFQYGTIKRSSLNAYLGIRGMFQFNMVQLKLFRELRSVCFKKSFNSNMVQLRRQRREAERLWFQFNMVQLRELKTNNTIVLFQFQYGTISVNRVM